MVFILNQSTQKCLVTEIFSNVIIITKVTAVSKTNVDTNTTKKFVIKLNIEKKTVSTGILLVVNLKKVTKLSSVTITVAEEKES